MKALGFTEHGDLSKMQILDLPKPTPGFGEVLVAVKASALNHLDIWVRQGWPGLNLQLPHIAGSDAAGDVVALGDGVTSVAVGTRVAIDPGINLYDDEYTASGRASVSPGYRILGEPLPGTHTEYVVVPAKNVVPMPEHISYIEAAAAGLVSVTAWRMLVHQAGMRLGQSVLIHGAGGGVNSMSIQLAKLAGCTVYATTSSVEKAEKAKVLGADHVFNYRTDDDWAKQLWKLTGKQGVDIVVDNIGQATMQTSIKAVKPGGCIVIVGNTSGANVELDLRNLFVKQISLIGSTMGSHADYHRVMQLVFAGKIKAPIYKTLSLDDGVQAMKVMEQGEQFGKIVLQAGKHS